MRGSGRKWNCSDSSDYDSGQLMTTPLATSIFDFHLVEGALSTATILRLRRQWKKAFIEGDGCCEPRGRRKGRRFPNTQTCFRNFERNIRISKCGQTKFCMVIVIIIWSDVVCIFIHRWNYINTKLSETRQILWYCFALSQLCFQIREMDGLLCCLSCCLSRKSDVLAMLLFCACTGSSSQ